MCLVEAPLGGEKQEEKMCGNQSFPAPAESRGTGGAEQACGKSPQANMDRNKLSWVVSPASPELFCLSRPRVCRPESNHLEECFRFRVHQGLTLTPYLQGCMPECVEQLHACSVISNRLRIW